MQGTNAIPDNQSHLYDRLRQTEHRNARPERCSWILCGSDRTSTSQDDCRACNHKSECLGYNIRFLITHIAHLHSKVIGSKRTWERPSVSSLCMQNSTLTPQSLHSQSSDRKAVHRKTPVTQCGKQRNCIDRLSVVPIH